MWFAGDFDDGDICIGISQRNQLDCFLHTLHTLRTNEVR